MGGDVGSEMGLSRVVAASRHEWQRHGVGNEIVKMGLYSEYSLSLSPVAFHCLCLTSLFSFLFFSFFPSFFAFSICFWTAGFFFFSFLHFFFFKIYMGNCLLGWSVGIGMVLVHDFWREA